MGECKLDHSVEDVQKKLAEQSPFLPQEKVEQLRAWLETKQSQEGLNELFHLLKKYDLATPEERALREEKMALLLG
ncbi:50S ribosomal protein L7ae [Brevibacillus choshinensis]|uniref:50S ribosomal protein L7ae n=1 Tax=Brevibacillus choshinensis TaxID=54911 RepID=A0ABX7FIF3_BRECH|nr:50S ribosomal protein L7ae [Brevibacillus choshinensis]QRG65106.1 50S ribosomal protein L7ae [Brevibacillus choshinensis]